MIVARQRRLLPITIVHLVVNLGDQCPAVVLPDMQGADLSPSEQR